MKEKLLAYLARNPRSSFSEIEALFKREGYDYQGEATLEVEGYNIMFWANWNNEAIGLVNSLVKAGEIEFFPASWVERMCFGKSFALPIAKRAGHRYKRMHWLPVVVSAAEGRTTAV